VCSYDVVSLRLSIGKTCMMHSICLSLAENLVSLQPILKFEESCLRGRQTHFGLILDQSFGSVVVVEINCNFAFGIRQNRMVSQHSRLVYLAEIVCRSRSRVCVSISWRRSCVNLVPETVCRPWSRVGFIDIRLRFEKSSPRWRI